MVLGCGQKKDITTQSSAPSTRAQTAGGSVALIGGIAAIVIAAMLAAGTFGGGQMYVAAGGLAISSTPLFILSAILLAKRCDYRIRTTGSRDTVTTDENQFRATNQFQNLQTDM